MSISFSLSNLCPDECLSPAISESQVRKELAREEEERLAGGGIALHGTSASAFVVHALELEDAQYVFLYIYIFLFSNKSLPDADFVDCQRKQGTGQPIYRNQLWLSSGTSYGRASRHASNCVLSICQAYSNILPPPHQHQELLQ